MVHARVEERCGCVECGRERDVYSRVCVRRVLYGVYGCERLYFLTEYAYVCTCVRLLTL